MATEPRPVGLIDAQLIPHDSDIGRVKSRNDRGAVAIEAALIFPVIVVMLFGIIEFSMMLRDHVSLTAAARSGVRTASSEPRVSTFSDDAAASVLRAGTALPSSTIQELWVYQAGTNGFPTGESAFTSCSTNCVKYTYDTTTKAFVKDNTTSWASTTIVACAGAADVTSIGVLIKARHQYVTGLFGTSMTLGDHAVMRFEPIPSTGVTGVGVCRP